MVGVSTVGRWAWRVGGVRRTLDVKRRQMEQSWSRYGNDLFLSVYESGGGEWAESAGKGGVAR